MGFHQPIMSLVLVFLVSLLVLLLLLTDYYPALPPSLSLIFPPSIPLLFPDSCLRPSVIVMCDARYSSTSNDHVSSIKARWYIKGGGSILLVVYIGTCM